MAKRFSIMLKYPNLEEKQFIFKGQRTFPYEDIAELLKSIALLENPDATETYIKEVPVQ